MANRLQRWAKQLRMRVGYYSPEDVAMHAGILPYAKTAVPVSPQSAMGVAAVYACVQKISSSLASMSLNIYKQDAAGRHIAEGHKVNKLLQMEPAPDLTSMEFWEGIISHACMYGVGYARIIFGADGRPEFLLPLDNSTVTRKVTDAGTFYKIQGGEMLSEREMFTVCNLFRSSPIRMHASSIGLSQAALNFGNEYFSNGGQMTGVLTSEQALREDQVRTVQASWNNSGTQAGTKLLPFGFKYQRVSVSPDEAQYIETRKLGAEEIARIFSVPGSLIGIAGQATYNNMEAQNLHFKQHCLLPWARRVEQEIDRKLLLSSERSRYYARYDMDSLSRADSASRSEYYQQALAHGWMNVNEVRAREDLNGIGAKGDIYRTQVNTLSLDHLQAYSEKLSEKQGATEAAPLE